MLILLVNVSAISLEIIEIEQKNLRRFLAHELEIKELENFTMLPWDWSSPRQTRNLHFLKKLYFRFTQGDWKAREQMNKHSYWINNRFRKEIKIILSMKETIKDCWETNLPIKQVRYSLYCWCSESIIAKS